jgi:hypothetical protein
MTIQALDRVALVHPLPDMGNRDIQGITTLIANREWQMVADYQRGTLGDVTIFRNTNVFAKNDDGSDKEPNWQWYAAVPTANIKSYRLGGDLPSLADMTAQSNGESKTQNPQNRSQAGSAGK